MYLHDTHLSNKSINIHSIIKWAHTHPFILTCTKHKYNSNKFDPSSTVTAPCALVVCLSPSRFHQYETLFRQSFLLLAHRYVCLWDTGSSAQTEAQMGNRPAPVSLIWTGIRLSTPTLLHLFLLIKTGRDPCSTYTFPSPPLLIQLGRNILALSPPTLLLLRDRQL